MDQTTSRVDFANTLRGIAAVCVLIAHYTYNFWTLREAVASLAHAPVLPEHFAFPMYLRWLHETIPQFNWGAFGVSVFFLVSGFVIPFSLRNMTWQGFLVGRLFRIIPLYMAGFSITILSIWLVGRYFGVQWPFSISGIAILYLPGLREFFGMPSIDGIVWTLEIEIKFYLVCALGIALFRRGSIWVFAIPAALAACEFYMISSGFGQTAILPIPFLIFMFIGVVFHYLHVGALTAERALFLNASLFFGFSILLGQAMPGLASMAWTYGFAVLVFAFAASFPQLFQRTRIGNFFADISYPLYVIHGVAGYAGLRVLIDLGVKAWLSLIIITAGATGLAWVLHVVVETPSHNLGKRLAAHLRLPIVSQLPDIEPVPASALPAAA
ncbi:acyltransferase [Mesorhizobium sp. B1-1-6]|uniref:acyltransferase family protein n=1 Tax=Mesorhizobium sp. B1-1-6 TaxID=2589978 RepID=UPI001126717B|nr:acyltransferase [Mesorhizobium sp. B1-1-6]TPN34810.1 acyltransferase [Mesorhizobium sp. B1-1-6]